MKRLVVILACAVALLGCAKMSSITSSLPAQDPLASPTQLANALMANTLTEAQMGHVLQKPFGFHLEVAREIALRQGKTATETDSLVADLSRDTPLRFRQSGTAAITGTCDQPVEYKTVVRDPVWAYTYTSYNDPNRGTEYLFYYKPWWTVNSDNVRWASTDGQVTWALWISYGSLSGYNLCSKPFWLRTGNKGTWWAGGPNRVFNSLYVHHL